MNIDYECLRGISPVSEIQRPIMKVPSGVPRCSAMFREMYANIGAYIGRARVHYKAVENPAMEKNSIKTALKDSLTFPRVET